jgi:hypothetical protein
MSFNTSMHVDIPRGSDRLVEVGGDACGDQVAHAVRRSAAARHAAAVRGTSRVIRAFGAIE